MIHHYEYYFSMIIVTALFVSIIVIFIIMTIISRNQTYGAIGVLYHDHRNHCQNNHHLHHHQNIDLNSINNF